MQQRRARRQDRPVVNGRWVLAHLPAKPPEPKAVQHFTSDTIACLDTQR